jgi:hypothetical protein
MNDFITKAHCNKCLGQTNHDLLHTQSVKNYLEDDPSTDIYFHNKYELLQCRGCNNVKLRLTTSFSEDPRTDISYFPPAISRKRPEWLYDVDNDFIDNLLREIYVGLQNNCRRLATLGIRALLEHIMIDNVGDQGTFVNNLGKFKSNGFIAQKQKEIIEIALEVGHATMHRSHNPSEKDLKIIIGIIENLIESIYVHSREARKLSSKLPKRKR